MSDSARMDTYAARTREDQRLLILQRLQRENDYQAHEHLLRAHLAEFGHKVSADALRGHLAWLDEQGLITLAGDRIQIAVLTLRGEDAALGNARVPGIARPYPER
jgi:hypothetical protein